MTGFVTKKYRFMSRVTILCHSKKELDFYIYIYIYDTTRESVNVDYQSFDSLYTKVCHADLQQISIYFF
jgi:hypothetical protein